MIGWKGWGNRRTRRKTHDAESRTNKNLTHVVPVLEGECFHYHATDAPQDVQRGIFPVTHPVISLGQVTWTFVFHWKSYTVQRRNQPTTINILAYLLRCLEEKTKQKHKAMVGVPSPSIRHAFVVFNTQRIDKTEVSRPHYSSPLTFLPTCLRLLQNPRKSEAIKWIICFLMSRPFNYLSQKILSQSILILNSLDASECPAHTQKNQQQQKQDKNKKKKKNKN